MVSLIFANYMMILIVDSVATLEFTKYFGHFCYGLFSFDSDRPPEYWSGHLFFLWFRYVQTLKGRKRFLSKIKVGNSKEKAKAERQAVNSICQVASSYSSNSCIIIFFLKGRVSNALYFYLLLKGFCRRHNQDSYD